MQIARQEAPGQKAADYGLPKNLRMQVAVDQAWSRALNKFRDGVQAALEAVGHGVLQHPANGELVSKLQSAALSIQDFFRQPLRLVHQLLFLCVAEDRGLLFPPGVSLERRRIYHQGYSLSRLRLPKPANSALAGSEASGEQEAAEQGAGTSVRTFSGPADRQD